MASCTMQPPRGQRGRRDTTRPDDPLSGPIREAGAARPAGTEARSWILLMERALDALRGRRRVQRVRARAPRWPSLLGDVAGQQEAESGTGRRVQDVPPSQGSPMGCRTSCVYRREAQGSGSMTRSGSMSEVLSVHWTLQPELT